jgi:DNA mismatch repair protein MutS
VAASKGHSPVILQFLRAKEQYPDALLFFRMGDFYELFFDDAVRAAELLGIVQTFRGKDPDGNPIPMAGVPHHAAEGYVARLIALGRTVVMVDQVEDPKKAKGLVRREVTRILTPGTFVDPEAPPRATSHLAALARAPGKRLELGLAALDVATGTFRATQAEQLEVVVDELARLEARELLVAASWRDDPATAPLLAQLAVALPSLTLTFLEADEAAPGPARAALWRGSAPRRCRHWIPCCAPRR